MSPYASVVVRTHDRAATLPFAVASLQRQTVPDIEILIVGDGATPEVAAIAEAISAADRRVRFLRFDKAPGDGGLNADRAIGEAASERIFYSDDDDVWLAQHVATLGPQLDAAHIADSLPVSVGAIPIGASPRLHGTIVNSANGRVRQLLAEDRLKLIYDTHVAHRRSTYLELGRPWAAAKGPSVTAVLAAFASAPAVRWKTIPLPTALSLHGSARSDAMATARRREIEACLERASASTPQLLLDQLDFSWHLMRTLSAEPPSADDDVASYLARYGVDWRRAPACGGRDGEEPLGIAFNESQRRAIEQIFALFQGHALDAQALPGALLVSLLDRVHSPFADVESAQRILQPWGQSTALQICARARAECPEAVDLIRLLEAHVMIGSGTTDEVRREAERLSWSETLAPFDIARLLVRCDLADGDKAQAIARLQEIWLARKIPIVGLELARWLIAGARAGEAAAICGDLSGRVSGHPWLREMTATLEQARVPSSFPPAAPLSEATAAEIAGYIDAVNVEGDVVYVSGWAVDVRTNGPVRRLAAIVDGETRGVCAPTIGREDAAMAVASPGAVVCGFLLAARLSDGREAERLRVVAIASDGAARELVIRWALRRKLRPAPRASGA